MERCRAELPKLNASLTTLERLDNALQAPPARGYQPPPKPQPPNPEQLARLASYDQELELDNHAKALAAWEADKRWGERQWKRRRSEQRQTLERQRQAEIKALGQANPRLVVSSDGSTSPELDPAAVAVYTSCAPDALAKLAGPPGP